MTTSQASTISNHLFDLANNYTNEMWNVAMSQVKFYSVTQQQLGVALMNSFQKHHLAEKEQMAIVETMAEQLKQGQQKVLDSMQEQFNQNLEKFKKMGWDCNSKA